MKLQAKIRAEYLDQLLNGEKEAEYRQFESITLIDENDRSRAFEIVGMRLLTNRQEAKIIDKYPNVPWDRTKQIIKLSVKPVK